MVCTVQSERQLLEHQMIFGPEIQHHIQSTLHLLRITQSSLLIRSRASNSYGNFNSLLKIWNKNDLNGVVGVFNCQGAGWCKVGKKNLIHEEQPGTITGSIKPKDVEYLPRVAGDTWNGDAVVYSHLLGDLVYLPKGASLPVTLKAREYEVFTVVPISEISNTVRFAPIGLTNMFNAGGAIKI